MLLPHPYSVPSVNKTKAAALAQEPIILISLTVLELGNSEIAVQVVLSVEVLPPPVMYVVPSPSAYQEPSLLTAIAAVVSSPKEVSKSTQLLTVPEPSCV